MEFNFGSNNIKAIDSFLSDGHKIKTSKCQKEEMKVGKISIASKFRKYGAKVYDSTQYKGSVIVDFGRTMTASKKDVDFVKVVLSECKSGVCGLINQPEDAIWDIDQIGNNKFLVTQKV